MRRAPSGAHWGCRSPVILATTFFMSHGARNCPFLIFTTRPVFAAAISRSVWRHRKAGICSTSTTGGECRALLALMHIGHHRQPEARADLGKDRQRASKPMPRLPGGWCGWPCRTTSCRRGRCRAARDLLQRGRPSEGMRAAFHLARSGEQRHRPVVGQTSRCRWIRKRWVSVNRSCGRYSIAHAAERTSSRCLSPESSTSQTPEQADKMDPGHKARDDRLYFAGIASG